MIVLADDAAYKSRPANGRKLIEADTRIPAPRHQRPPLHGRTRSDAPLHRLPISKDMQKA